MKRIIFLLSLVALFANSLSIYARGQEDSDLVQFKKEFREYKHRFLSKQLELTKDQEMPFFDVYDRMEDETAKITNETRDFEKKLMEAEEVSDLEYDTATDALFELKIKEGEIEKSYLEKLRTILTKKQLFLLKSAERKFNRELMLHQQRTANRAKKN